MASQDEILDSVNELNQKLDEIIEILIYQNTTDRAESKRQLIKKYDKLRVSKKPKGGYDYDGYDGP